MIAVALGRISVPEESVRSVVAFFGSGQKIVMIFLMWLGRLEFFAVLALLQPRFWTR